MKSGEFLKIDLLQLAAAGLLKCLQRCKKTAALDKAVELSGHEGVGLWHRWKSIRHSDFPNETKGIFLKLAPLLTKGLIFIRPV